MSEEESKKKKHHEHDPKDHNHVNFYNSYGPAGSYAGPNKIPCNDETHPEAPAPETPQPGSGANPPNPQ